MYSDRFLLNTFVSATLLLHGAPLLAETADERLESLDQKVRVLERKLELSEEDAAAKAKQQASVSAGDTGVAIKSAGGDFELRFRGYQQGDSRNFFGDSDYRLTNTFLVRKARPVFEGTFAKYFDYRLMPEFAGSSVSLQDAYVDVKYWQAATIRAGKFKAPVSLRRVHSDTDTLFAERALVTALSPDRDSGVQRGGAVLDNTVLYAVGVFNGVADGASSTTDANDRKDVAARLFFQPWYNAPGALQGLGFGVAGSTGYQEATDVNGLRSAGQATIFAYRSSTTAANNVVANGNHSRLVSQLYYYKNNVGLIAEYARSKQDVQRGTAVAGLEHTAWDVEVNWVVTGEDASYKGVNPASNFAPGIEGWGAFELGLRYGELDIDEQAFTLYADPATSVSEAKNVGVVLIWYLNRNVKLAIDYNQTEFTGGAAAGAVRPTEKLVLGRLQLAY